MTQSARPLLAATVFAALTASMAYGQAPTPAAKPNIVFVLMDNLGYGEVGAYGGGITRGAPTPQIDELATEGLRLTNFNVEAQCTPSRSAILTGRFSIRSGTHSVPIGEGLDGLTQWEVTLAETLSDAGYATGAFGKWHLGSTQGRLPNDRVLTSGTAFPERPMRPFGRPTCRESSRSGVHPYHGGAQGQEE